MYVEYRKSKEIHKSVRKALDLVVVLNDVQYAKNVAEAFQIAGSFKISKLILTGSTVTPPFGNDLQKASLFEEKKIAFEYQDDINICLAKLNSSDYRIWTYSLNDKSQSIVNLCKNVPAKLAIIFGNETNGLSKLVIEKSDSQFFIPTNLHRCYLTTNLALAITINTIFLN